jgi:hypothetical protein
MEVPKRTNLSFHFSSQLIRNILKGFIFLNFFFLFGTWLHNSLLLADKWYLIPRLIALLDLAKENNLAAWYSSMFMIIVALAAFFCFLVDFLRLKKTKDQIMNLGWLVLGLIFLVLSFDEMGSFHEMIGNTPKLKNIGVSNNATRIAFFGLIAIIGVFMVGFSFLKFRGNKMAFVFAAIGVILLISNPFQEMYEMHSWRTSIDPSKWRRPIFFMILEEGTEIFASFCFLKAFILYSLNPEGGKTHGLINKDFRIRFFVNNIYIYVLSAFIICSGLVMIIFRIDSWEIAWNKGIPHNWFPSAMSLLVALIGSYLYFLSRDKSLPNKITLLLITLVSLLTSAFYGCNMYDSLVMPFFKIPIPLFGASVLIGGLAFIHLEGIKTKVSMAAGVLCLILAIYNRWGFFTAMSGYWAASFLLLALVFYYQQITLRLNKIL